MVKCWNCKNLARAYSGTPAEGKRFRKEYRKCKVKGTVFELRSDISEERECDIFEQPERWAKKQEPPTFSRIHTLFLLKSSRSITEESLQSWVWMDPVIRLSPFLS